MSKVDFPLLVARAVRNVSSIPSSAPSAGVTGHSLLRPDGSLGPVASLVDGLLLAALEQEASDIHIEPADAGQSLRIRLRVDGFLRPVPGLEETIPRLILPNLINRLKVMPAPGRTLFLYCGLEREGRDYSGRAGFGHPCPVGGKGGSAPVKPSFHPPPGMS